MKLTSKFSEREPLIFGDEGFPLVEIYVGDDGLSFDGVDCGVVCDCGTLIKVVDETGLGGEGENGFPVDGDDDDGGGDGGVGGVTGGYKLNGVAITSFLDRLPKFQFN
jgi:hypothetical protein